MDFGSVIKDLLTGGAANQGATAVPQAAASGFKSNLLSSLGSAAPSIGLGALTSYLGAKDANANRKLQQEQAAQSQANQQQQFKQSQALTGLEATQMNPFTQQSMRGRQALAGQLLGAYSPQSYDAEAKKWNGGIDFSKVFSGLQSFYSPEAMAEAERTFTGNVRQASPGYNGADLARSGYSTEVASAPASAAAHGGVDPALLERLKGYSMPQSMSRLGGLVSGASTGAGLGSMAGPIGTGIGAAGGALMGLFTGKGQGAQVNDARDAYKSLFGDAQGTGLAQTFQPYEQDPQVAAALQAFNTAGKRDQLGSAISQLSSFLASRG